MDKNLINELINSCYKPNGNFHFRNLSELTTFVLEQGGILYPVSIHYTFGYFILAYLIDDPEDKKVSNIIRDSHFQFQEVTEQYLKQLRNGDIKRPFSTENGEDQFFYYDGKKEKLFLISQILD